jgi:hypothetical protein
VREDQLGHGEIHPDYGSYRALSATASATQILADAIGTLLPTWLVGAMIHFPTTAFRALRQAKIHANHVGREIVHKKMEAAAQGLEMNADVFSALRMW